MNYPTNEADAKVYANYLTTLHSKPWIAIKRIEPIENRFAINFAAIEPKELEDCAEQWKTVDSV